MGIEIGLPNKIILDLLKLWLMWLKYWGKENNLICKNAK
jgi:hypothetical protein